MSTTPDDYRTLATPPPPVTVVRAMLWHWWIVAISVVACVGIGIGVALVRTPEYTATSRLAVGRIDISSPGALSGFAVATQALATGYSRTVTALAVAEAVSKETGVSVRDAQDHVTATPVAESPVFKVEATAPDSEQAIELANAASRALIAYVNRLNQSNPDGRRLYDEYRQAVLRQKLARRQLESREHSAGGNPSGSVEEEINVAISEVEAASLRVDALGKAYTASVQGQVATHLIQVISPATVATSDRRSTAMILAFVGLVVGLLLGGGIAYFRESRIGARHP